MRACVRFFFSARASGERRAKRATCSVSRACPFSSSRVATELCVPSHIRLGFHHARGEAAGVRGRVRGGERAKRESSLLSLSLTVSHFRAYPSRSSCESQSRINFPRIPRIVLVSNDCLLIVQGQRHYINGPRIKWQQRGVVEHNPS